MKDYNNFLLRKSVTDNPSGFVVDKARLHPKLFDFQADIVQWALARGRSSVFCDCGMGKTFMQLEWARHIPGDVLILAPLAVASQTVAEGKKFGINVTRCLSQDDVKPGINIANYERLESFNPGAFTGVVLDESSILKAYDGKTRTAILGAFKRTPYKLAATATPSPNDYMELGNHAEFMGVMSREEMLAMFFTHDGGETQKWRLKGHAESDFWKWVCSWAVMIRKPSDLGYDDGGFKLPPVEFHEHIVRATNASEGELFAMPAASLQERIAARRATVKDRADKCAALAGFDKNQWLIWCNLNSESEALKNAIPGAVEIKGSDSAETKENAVQWFKGELCLCHLTKKNIYANGKQETKNGLKNIEKKQGTEEIKEDANFTQQKNGEGSNKDKRLSNGKLKTQKRDLPRDCGNLELQQKNTEKFLNPNQECVQSADEIRIKTTGFLRDSTLTMTTKQEESEDFSVPPAILDLENSKTTQESSKVHICICGHTSGRRVLISKSSIFGFGLNLQNCANVAFVGLTDSYEEFYQAVRRCWRFGQKKRVKVHIIVADTEGAVLENIKRKERDSEDMAIKMVENMKDLNKEALTGATKQQKATYKTAEESGDRWTMRLGDCVQEIKAVEDSSIHYSVYSPPFASLYTYSNSDRDMGNCKDMDEFIEHYKFLVKEIFRATKPGRLTSFHCMDLPTSKVRDGVIGLRDFRGELIRIHQEAGWVYHSGVTIWKDPVTAMQRTKAIGLLYKQLKKDSHLSRQGIPDYLVTMRKPGENPEPITHTPEDFPVDLWQKYASPVWMDIDPNETLQFRTARENNDERHICPLQLEVIRRAMKLWSNSGDLVLSPFAGIGSEGHEAIKAGRRFLGFELKESYWKCAINNLRAAEKSLTDGVLF